MTTIRDALTPKCWTATERIDAILDHLGIDPDAPAEWATVDACLNWLRERGWFLNYAMWNGDGYETHLVHGGPADVPTAADALARLVLHSVGAEVGRELHEAAIALRAALTGEGIRDRHDIGPTLCAALLAACQAIQEAGQ